MLRNREEVETTLKTEIEKSVDKLIKKENPIFVYGGQTSKTTGKRKNEHISTDNRFEKMRIRQIYKTTDPHICKELETFLIQLLDKKFKHNCFNDRNDDGKIANRGGSGRKILNGTETEYKIYIMFK